MYKSSTEPIWTYGMQLWESAKTFNSNKIQRFQNITHRQIINSPPYVYDFVLHADLL